MGLLEGFVQGWLIVLSPAVLLFLFIGVVVGFFVGILPGLGVITTIAIILPFIWKSSPETSLALLMGLCAAPITAGAITAILLNIPGEDSNVVTCLDGYPMNQRGEGGRAIVIAVTASTFGGLAGVIMALVMIPLIIPVVMAFTFPELFFLILLGLTFIVTLSGRNLGKGMMSGGIGILISLIGYHSSTGIPRFTFGSMFLYDGFSLAVFLMGLFGLSEMIQLILSKQSTIAKAELATITFKDVPESIKAIVRYKWVFLRSVIIGYIIGVIPGIGTSTSNWLAYGQAKQMSKNPERFGKGSEEGLIAVQSAMAATIPGALLTTMVFGIPGAALMAVMMGGFLMVGVTPGPALIKEHLALAFALPIGVAVAFVMVAAICIATAKYMARVAKIDVVYLIPIVMIVIYVAAFVTEGRFLDLIVALFAGCLGVIITRYGYSRAAICMGFVLGRLFEHYLLLSRKQMGPLFFLRPISMVIIVMTALLFAYPSLVRMARTRRDVKA